MKNWTRKLISLSLFTLLLVSFQNCSSDFMPHGQDAMLSTLNVCDADLSTVFASTYHPFLSTTCKSCHVSGPGKGAFASPVVAVAYRDFQLATAEKVTQYALNPNHAPVAGPQNQAALDSAKGAWDSTMAAKASCQGTGLDATIKKTIARQINATAAYKTFSWNLDTELVTNAASYDAATFSINVKMTTLASGQKIYYFSSPTVTTKSKALHLKNLEVYINGVKLPQVTAWTEIDQTIAAAQTAVKISTSVATAEFSVESTDVIQISFGDLSPQ